MRVVVLGGTRFIGRALVAELTRAGHEVLLVHRGEHETAEVAELPHVHIDRRRLGERWGEVEAFAPEALVDTSAMTAEDAETLLAVAAPDLRLVVVSSIDVLRAFGSLWSGRVSDPVPLDEGSPVRSEPSPDRGVRREGWGFDLARYEKLDVERAYLERGATVCRLPFVYGEHDYQRREEPILRRVRETAERIEIGAGTWLGSRGYVGDIAGGLRLALESGASRGEVFQFAEWPCHSIRAWVEQILDATGWSGELVQVPDDDVAEDLELTMAISQHLLIDPGKARRILGWRHGDPVDRVARSVRWHLANPPPGTGRRLNRPRPRREGERWR